LQQEPTRNLPDSNSLATNDRHILVEGFGDCANATCPAVLILSGSRGFGASVCDEIGLTFRRAGLNAYLVHVLSPADLDAIATASSTGARIAYYAQRLEGRISALQKRSFLSQSSTE